MATALGTAILLGKSKAEPSASSASPPATTTRSGYLADWVRLSRLLLLCRGGNRLSD
jgi:hypothetical protein